MGTNTLNTVAEPAVIEDADLNQYFTALSGDFIPRNVSTGAPEDNINKLGRPAFRWKEAHITDLFLGGSLFDPDVVGVDTKFAINSGATRTDSGQPDFLRADGTGASATILATTTPLQITATGVSVTVSVDIAITSLTVAPSSNNTALVNDTALSGGAETKYTGENLNDPLTIDTVGTEISNRVGEYICLKTPTGEFMFAFVENATTLKRCYRGFFFDDTGAPVVRGVLSNNDTLTIMSLGWVFLDNDGVTVDVSYTSPIYSGVEPASPVTDDYWFDLKNRLWKRFDGAVFQQVDRMLIGLVVIDGTNAVVARSFDFTKGYDDFIDLEVELESVTEVKTQKGYSRLSVYGQTHELYAGQFLWDITADLESGLTEASSTDYYLYITEEGIPTIATERPFERESELKGYYHPYHSWRFVGMAFNDGSSDFTTIRSKNNPFEKRQEVFTSAFTFIPLPNANKLKITVVAGGGGGGDATNGGNGGTSSFGAHASATGGVGGDNKNTEAFGGTGGVGSGGDVNIAGSDGGTGGGITSPNMGFGGYGGSTILGGGGRNGIQVSVRIAPLAGNDFGGGGGGDVDGTRGGGGGGGGGCIYFIYFWCRGWCINNSWCRWCRWYWRCIGRVWYRNSGVLRMFYARIEGNIVREILESDKPPVFHKSLIFVKCNASVKEGHSHNDGIFTPPEPETPRPPREPTDTEIKLRAIENKLGLTRQELDNARDELIQTPVIDA